MEQENLACQDFPKQVKISNLNESTNTLELVCSN